MTRHVLVTGGAGYIGSHMVRLLDQQGYQITVIDNLINGHRDALVDDVELVAGEVGNQELLDDIFTSHKIDAVLHFAGRIEIGDSFSYASLFHSVNVEQSLRLLESMKKHEIGLCIFSSSAAVYGKPESVPIDEFHPCYPVNPYGENKLEVERAMKGFVEEGWLNYGALRYFNAAGGDPDGTLGECHEPETHLIPLALQVASGRREILDLYGDDYPTRDGTCIRDYVHVMDLCQAHLSLLEYKFKGGKESVFNLGSGHGWSVKQVIEMVEHVSDQPVKTRVKRKRRGDVPELVADYSKAERILNWQPSYSLEDMVRHAWAWELRLATGEPFAR